MIESEVRQFFETAQKPSPSIVDEIAAEVSLGIRLEEGIGHKTTKEVRDSLVKEIATTVFYASNFLGTPPWPSFGLIYEWGSKPPEKYRSQNRIVLASADVDDNNPYGLINFTPYYLEATAGFMMGVNNINSLTHGHGNPLSKVTAHESYHIWQYFELPKSMERQTEVLFSAGLCAWEKTRAERSAKLFEDIFEGGRNHMSIHRSKHFATINED